ncbi:MAG: cell division protein FtsA [Anaerolineales bacterium]|nr:cell division protein FtsA [Anaerolineales bacterium]
MEHTIVGIDVGSSKVCTLVGEIDDNNKTRIIGVGLVPSRGVRKGVVVNVGEATAAIASSIERAEQTSGYKIERAFVSLSGTHISSINSRGVVGISRRERGIAEEDVDRVLEAARAIAVPHNNEVVHVIPRDYLVDGQGGVRDPVGMHGFRLEVETHIVTGASTSIQNLVQCVEGTGVAVDELVLSSLAAGDAVLTDTEREMGVVLADIGAGTVDLAVFIDGTVWHTTVMGVGGEYITADVAIGLRLQPAVAEQIKVQHGHAQANQVSPDARVTLSPFGEETPQVIPRWKLAEIVEARIEEIVLMIQQEIKRSGYDGLLPAGVVFTGGTAQLPGLCDLGREVFGLPVRVGAPSKELQGLVDQVLKPAYSVGVGLMGWGGTVSQRPQLRKEGPSGGKRLMDWLKAFLPS